MVLSRIRIEPPAYSLTPTGGDTIPTEHVTPDIQKDNRYYSSCSSSEINNPLWWDRFHPASLILSIECKGMVKSERGDSIFDDKSSLAWYFYPFIHSPDGGGMIRVEDIINQHKYRKMT
ncbi:MAG: hypothetical protein GY737_06910 [Desulfobacteraceae bacterium]|nr:hypothetical protein [Desulfobacteraceae bacterium]